MSDQVFVNLQDAPVQIFNEERRPVRVAPWEKRKAGGDGIYSVTGAHYEQFVSSQGPLFPCPQEAKPAPEASDKGEADGKGTGDGGSGAPEVETVSDYTIPLIKEMVAKMDDVEELNSWLSIELEGEARKGALDAIEKRIADIEEAAAGEGGEGDPEA
jgi:hypothetical protein